MNILALIASGTIAATLAPSGHQIFEIKPLPVDQGNDCSSLDCLPQKKVTTPKITATRTATKEKGLYVYEVHLTADGFGEVITMVSGRPWKQDAGEENVADTGAPLPPGIYTVAATIQSAPPEKFGGIFIPFEPLFDTPRYALGFHHDPEFVTGGPELGTMGCLATTTVEDRQKLIDFFRNYQPTHLTVR